MKIHDAEIPWIGAPFGYADPFRDYSFFQSGITDAMTVPATNGGTRFNRHMMNGLGYLASLGTYLHQCGYPFSMADVQKAATFGGYPKGAIVYTINDNGYVVEYRSKIDDNLNPVPALEDGLPVEDDNWEPLYETQQFVPIPDYSRLIGSVEETFTQENSEKQNTFWLKLEVEESCYIRVTRTIQNWDSFDKLYLLLGVPSINVWTRRDAAMEDETHIDDMPLSGGKEMIVTFPTGPTGVSVTSSDYNYEVYGPITIKIEAFKLRA